VEGVLAEAGLCVAMATHRRLGDKCPRGMQDVCGEIVAMVVEQLRGLVMARKQEAVEGARVRAKRQAQEGEDGSWTDVGMG